MNLLLEQTILNIIKKIKVESEQENDKEVSYRRISLSFAKALTDEDVLKDLKYLILNDLLIKDKK